VAPGVIEGPGDPVAVPPARRPDSVRRTSSVLMSWPDGLTGDLLLEGRARDLFTPADGEPAVLDRADLLARTGRMRDIQRIESDPEPAGLQRLVGCAAGGNLRKAIAEALPDEVEAGTPLYLLLDDLAGASLISGFAFFKWSAQVPQIQERVAAAPSKVMRNICSGFREGSSALTPEGTILAVSDNTPHPQALADPADPLGWHELHPHPDIAMRRARRIDVWWEDGALQIDAMFRDSVWDPDGLECVLHEYQMLGWADEEGTLRAINAVPRVLPYAECPLAAPNAAWLEGTPVRALRGEVLQRLKNADCCTHLNDALRSLAEVPLLASALPDHR
jgi:hypothetical protein